MRITKLYLPVVALFLTVCGTTAPAAETKYPKTIAQYEIVRAGLAADDVAAAKNGATNLVTAVEEEFAASKPMIEAAQKLAASESLADARSAFQIISKELARLVQGESGFFVMNCPMMKEAVWVQTTEKVANPYKGKAMLECGVVVKK